MRAVVCFLLGSSCLFRVGVTSDFLRPDGVCGFGEIGLDRLTQAGVEWQYFDSPQGEIEAAQADYFDGLLVLGPKVTANTLAKPGRLKIVARFGVGYDNVDTAACTAAGVLLTITPEGVRRPVAVAALTLILALSHKLLIKDRLTRAGRWSEKLYYNGQGVTGRTLGILGLGNIGQELAGLAKGVGLKVVAFDPWVAADRAAELGVPLLELKQLLQTCDYVCVCCALTAETRHLINAERLSWMQPHAYLINVARGPIVDQAALTSALQRGVIAGAGLDVFEQEPIDRQDPLLGLEQVILAPHAICWTDECFSLNGNSAVDSLLSVASGQAPRHIVNRDALHHPRLQNLHTA